MRRHRTRFFLVLLTMAGIGACTPDAPPPPEPKPRYSVDESLEGVRLDGTAEPPMTISAASAWSVDSGPVAVVGDLAVGVFASGSSPDGTLRVVDGVTGRPYWTAELSGTWVQPCFGAAVPPATSVDGAEATAYVLASSANESDDVQSYLLAIDLVRARTLWMRPVGPLLRDERSSLFGQARAHALPAAPAPPRACGSVVYTPDAVLVDAGSVYAFDPRTGERLWDRTGAVETVGPGIAVLRRAGTDPDGPEHVLGVDPATGRRLWVEPRYQRAFAHPSAGTVLLAGTSPVSLRDAESGAMLQEHTWKADDCRVQERSYVCVELSVRTDGAASAVALDARTGDQLWFTPAASEGMPAATAIETASSAYVYLSSPIRGTAAVLDADDGDVVRSGIDLIPLQAGNGFVLGKRLGPNTATVASYPVERSSHG